MTQSVRMLLFPSLLAVLLLTGVAVGRAQQPLDQKPIARIGDSYTIAFPELEDFVHDYAYGHVYRNNLVEGFRKALDDMIVNQLKRVDFFALKLDKSAKVLPRVKRAITEEIESRFYLSKFYAHYVGEDSMRSAYAQMGREVIYQQIVIGDPGSASVKSLDSLRRVVNAIRAKLHDGGDFTSLADEYSASRGGGALQRVDWKASLLGNDRYRIFHLPVNEVNTVVSGGAILIVKVVKVERQQVKPYVQVRDEIRKALSTHYSAPAYAEYERMKKGLIDERYVTWDPGALEQIAAWSRIPKFFQSGYEDSLREAIADGRNRVILKYRNGRVDFKEFLRLLNNVLGWGEKENAGMNDIKGFLLDAVRTSMIMEKAVKLGLDKGAFSATSPDPALRNEVLRLYDQHEIDDQIPPATEPALREFYQTNRDSLYYQLAKVNIYAIVDTSRSALEELKEKARQDVRFERLAPRVLVKAYVRKRDGTLATYLGTEPPILAEAAFKLKRDEIAGPVEFVDPAKGRQYALLKCIETREEKQLTYDDAKKNLPDDFAKYHRERIAEIVRERLKKKYADSVFIDKDLLQEYFHARKITP